MILDLIGKLIWAGCWSASATRSASTRSSREGVSHYGLWVTIALIVVVVFFQVRSQRQMCAPPTRPTPPGRPAPPRAADEAEAG